MSSDDGSSDSGLLNANETPYKSVKDSLPPVWVDKLEKAEEDLTKIQIKSALPHFFYFHFFFFFAVGGGHLSASSILAPQIVFRCILLTNTHLPTHTSNSERVECVAHQATNGKL